MWRTDHPKHFTRAKWRVYSCTLAERHGGWFMQMKDDFPIWDGPAGAQRLLSISITLLWHKPLRSQYIKSGLNQSTKQPSCSTVAVQLASCTKQRFKSQPFYGAAFTKSFELKVKLSPRATSRTCDSDRPCNKYWTVRELKKMLQGPFVWKGGESILLQGLWKGPWMQSAYYLN